MNLYAVVVVVGVPDGAEDTTATVRITVPPLETVPAGRLTDFTCDAGVAVLAMSCIGTGMEVGMLPGAACNWGGILVTKVEPGPPGEATVTSFMCWFGFNPNCAARLVAVLVETLICCGLTRLPALVITWG